MNEETPLGRNPDWKKGKPAAETRSKEEVFREPRVENNPLQKARRPSPLFESAEGANRINLRLRKFLPLSDTFHRKSRIVCKLSR
jgi:hypothetical protein